MGVIDLTIHDLPELKLVAEELTLEELYELINEQFEIYKYQHDRFLEKGRKTDEAKARRALGRIKILVAPYRRRSVEACDGYLGPSRHNN